MCLCFMTETYNKYINSLTLYFGMCMYLRPYGREVGNVFDLL